MTLAFSVDRTIDIRASCSTVFLFFTDPARWARWWGEGSTIDPVVGGAVLIVYPGGERVSGVALLCDGQVGGEGDSLARVDLDLHTIMLDARRTDQ